MAEQDTPALEKVETVWKGVEGASKDNKAT